MKQQVQLYIEGQQVELFGDETIVITSTIQDVKDISKIFTDFSQGFTVPASRNNNKIFKHYYNNSIVNGYDARFRSNAVLEVNYKTFRKGTVALTNVQMKNNAPYAYNLTFYGSTVTLSNLIGEDKLDVLTYLDNYNHEWNLTNVIAGLSGSTGLNLNGDNGAIIYPLLSPEKRFIFDSSGASSTAGARNIGNNTYPSEFNGIHLQDLKPAIRILHIIEAIEDRYGITFSRDFFNDTDFTELYMWLHREAGNIFQNTEESVVVAGDFAVDSSVTNCPDDYVTVNDKDFEFQCIRLSYDNRECDAELTVTPSSSEEYEIRVIDVNNNNEVLYNATGLTATHVHTITLDGGGVSFRQYKIQVQIVKPSGSTLSSVDVAWDTTTTRDTGPTTCTNTKTFSITSALALVSDIIVRDNVPDIKVMDFLTGIFKMFNLTAYVDENDVIVVKTLDTYYTSGTNYDITKYVDFEESNVQRPPLYNEIEYKFVKPVTFLADEFNNRNNQEFGSEQYKIVYNNKYIDGSKYTVQLPFEKVIYERLNDLADNTQSNIGYGYFVDKDQNPVKGNPLLFYSIWSGVTGDYLYIKPTSDDSVTQLNSYRRPSNVKSDQTQTLNFDQENDEYELVYNGQSLFSNFHSNYISSVFDYRSRLLKIKAILPLNILTKYNLNDRFIIGDTKYKINSITSNLLNNKSDLELIPDL